MNKLTPLAKIIEKNPDAQLLIADGFDSAIIGYNKRVNKVIYSVDKCLEILMERDGMNHMEAIDFFAFNVEGSYMGESTPIWSHDNNLEDEEKI